MPTGIRKTQEAITPDEAGKVADPGNHVAIKTRPSAGLELTVPVRTFFVSFALDPEP